MTRPALKRGFTLIELVAAMTIFAIIAVIAQQSLFSTMAHSDRLRGNASDLAELELAVSLVTRDLQNIAPRAARTGQAQSEPALILSDGGRSLGFTRSGVVDPTQAPRGPFVRVSYQQGLDQQVQRLVWDRVDRPGSSQPRQGTLWAGIKAARFAVYDNGQWLDSWPPKDKTDLTALPQGISVTFQTDRWGQIDRVVALQ